MGLLNWSDPLSHLFNKQRLTKSGEALANAGIIHIRDLLWLFPLRVQLEPIISDFSAAIEDSYFKGIGKVLGVSARPNFRAKGKGRAMLYNIDVKIEDLFSEKTMQLKWFNSYGTTVTKLKSQKYFEFSGQIQLFNGLDQIINPKITARDVDNLPTQIESVPDNQRPIEVTYSTINGLNSSLVKKVINKIPAYLWRDIPETIPEHILEERQLLSISESFNIIHGKSFTDYRWSEENENIARKRIIYEEFFYEQVKLFLRRQYIKRPKAPIFEIEDHTFDKFLNIFPYELTSDQIKVINEIKTDLKAKHPMMRLIQGDVGCGKTSVAMIASLITLENKSQVALMCPTEALAIQHFNEFSHYLEKTKFKTVKLLGSTKKKEKDIINEQLKSGKIDLIIGTHSLIQDNIEFKNLGLAIIDEQHKFGVNQRLKLVGKNIGTHCLIMTATPIPRSLSLTQYGDLDISTIKMMPKNRKGYKTRIITNELFPQFLNFINTRLHMDEQVYVVVPAITENENLDILNLEETLSKFKKFFPSFIVEGLHGQMKSEEKNKAFKDFSEGNINILVATSVIEVGINVPNASIMAILNPERFGLSSLHQLRGRVGRGEKPGFCFLVNDKQISRDSMNRLKVIETHTDGFKISEEDLKIRGEGDLFGTNQSGGHAGRRIANIIIHQDILFEAQEDVTNLIHDQDPLMVGLMHKISQDIKVFTTV